MPVSGQALRSTRKQSRRVNATTITLWIFVIVEAVGIGYVLFTR